MKTDIYGVWIMVCGGIEDTVSIDDERLTYSHGEKVQYSGGYSFDEKTSQISLTDETPIAICDYLEYSANRLYIVVFIADEGTKKYEYIKKGAIDPYLSCPTYETNSFVLRLVQEQDSDSLFECYNDKNAVALMNADNCDFGFYMQTKRQMKKTVAYWIDFYAKRGFIRFSVVDKASNKAVGTVEGFVADTGVLRIDMGAEYEKSGYLSELLDFAKNNFKAYFGNEFLVTKAIPKADERRKALTDGGWDYIGRYRIYSDYYRIELV